MCLLAIRIFWKKRLTFVQFLNVLSVVWLQEFFICLAKLDVIQLIFYLMLPTCAFGIDSDIVAKPNIMKLVWFFPKSFVVYILRFDLLFILN